MKNSDDVQTCLEAESITQHGTITYIQRNKNVAIILIIPFISLTYFR